MADLNGLEVSSRIKSSRSKMQKLMESLHDVEISMTNDCDKILMGSESAGVDSGVPFQHITSLRKGDVLSGWIGDVKKESDTIISAISDITNTFNDIVENDVINKVKVMKDKIIDNWRNRSDKYGESDENIGHLVRMFECGPGPERDDLYAKVVRSLPESAEDKLKQINKVFELEDGSIGRVVMLNHTKVYNKIIDEINTMRVIYGKEVKDGLEKLKDRIEGIRNSVRGTSEPRPTEWIEWDRLAKAVDNDSEEKVNSVLQFFDREDVSLDLGYAFKRNSEKGIALEKGSNKKISGDIVIDNKKKNSFVPVSAGGSGKTTVSRAITRWSRSSVLDVIKKKHPPLASPVLDAISRVSSNNKRVESLFVYLNSFVDEVTQRHSTDRDTKARKDFLALITPKKVTDRDFEELGKIVREDKKRRNLKFDDSETEDEPEASEVSSKKPSSPASVVSEVAESVKPAEASEPYHKVDFETDYTREILSSKYKEWLEKNGEKDVSGKLDEWMENELDTPVLGTIRNVYDLLTKESVDGPTIKRVLGKYTSKIFEMIRGKDPHPHMRNFRQWMMEEINRPNLRTEITTKTSPFVRTINDVYDIKPLNIQSETGSLLGTLKLFSGGRIEQKALEVFDRLDDGRKNHTPPAEYNEYIDKCIGEMESYVSNLEEGEEKELINSILGKFGRHQKYVISLIYKYKLKEKPDPFFGDLFTSNDMAKATKILVPNEKPLNIDDSKSTFSGYVKNIISPPKTTKKAYGKPIKNHFSEKLELLFKEVVETHDKLIADFLKLNNEIKSKRNVDGYKEFNDLFKQATGGEELVIKGRTISTNKMKAAIKETLDFLRASDSILRKACDILNLDHKMGGVVDGLDTEEPEKYLKERMDNERSIITICEKFLGLSEKNLERIRDLDITFQMKQQRDHFIIGINGIKSRLKSFTEEVVKSLSESDIEFHDVEDIGDSDDDSYVVKTASSDVGSVVKKIREIGNDIVQGLAHIKERMGKLYNVLNETSDFREKLINLEDLAERTLVLVKNEFTRLVDKVRSEMEVIRHTGVNLSSIPGGKNGNHLLVISEKIIEKYKKEIGNREDAVTNSIEERMVDLKKEINDAIETGDEDGVKRRDIIKGFNEYLYRVTKDTDWIKTSISRLCENLGPRSAPISKMVSLSMASFQSLMKLKEKLETVLKEGRFNLTKKDIDDILNISDEGGKNPFKGLVISYIKEENTTDELSGSDNPLSNSGGSDDISEKIPELYGGGDGVLKEVMGEKYEKYKHLLENRYFGNYMTRLTKDGWIESGDEDERGDKKKISTRSLVEKGDRTESENNLLKSALVGPFVLFSTIMDLTPELFGGVVTESGLAGKVLHLEEYHRYIKLFSDKKHRLIRKIFEYFMKDDKVESCIKDIETGDISIEKLKGAILGNKYIRYRILDVVDIEGAGKIRGKNDRGEWDLGLPEQDENTPDNQRHDDVYKKLKIVSRKNLKDEVESLSTLVGLRSYIYKFLGGEGEYEVLLDVKNRLQKIRGKLAGMKASGDTDEEKIKKEVLDVFEGLIPNDIEYERDEKKERVKKPVELKTEEKIEEKKVEKKEGEDPVHIIKEDIKGKRVVIKNMIAENDGLIAGYTNTALRIDLKVEAAKKAIDGIKGLTDIIDGLAVRKDKLSDVYEQDLIRLMGDVENRFKEIGTSAGESFKRLFGNSEANPVKSVNNLLDYLSQRRQYIEEKDRSKIISDNKHTNNISQKLSGIRKILTRITNDLIEISDSAIGSKVNAETKEIESIKKMGHEFMDQCLDVIKKIEDYMSKRSEYSDEEKSKGRELIETLHKSIIKDYGTIVTLNRMESTRRIPTRTVMVDKTEGQRYESRY